MATAKISNLSHDIVQQISAQTGEKQIDIIEHALVAYERQWRMEQFNEAYAKLKSNKKAWKAELAERAILEGTIDDGLEDY
jgi:hypothetical protein